ncbi:MAG: hypothetical protein IAE97_08150 [Chthoniobacterales bacterium]|nr:hypothetical protein [Chthoniobacterales bacterium]
METFDIEEIWAQRREMAEQTITLSTVALVRTEVEKIFEGNNSHPWFRTCLDFLDGHATEPVLCGKLPENGAFIYFPRANQGIWYRFGGKLEAVGTIGPQGLQALSEIAASKDINR